MGNKKFLKVLKSERESLNNFKSKLPNQIRQNNLRTQNVLLDVTAGRILGYMFQNGKFKLIQTLKSLHKIAANVVLYMELQKRDTAFSIKKYIKGYQPEPASNKENLAV